MIIITCPNCSSKFRFSEKGIDRSTIKMRCSMCQHVFEHSLQPEVSLDQEFDMLLSANPTPETRGTPRPPFDETPLGEETSLDLTETPAEEVPEGKPAATESVIREIDSLLGAGQETKEDEEEEEVAPEGTEKRSHLKVVVLAVCLTTIVAASLWLFKDKILFFKEARQEAVQAPAEAGPSFSVEQADLTHEILTHDQEGSVLVIKGTLRKITMKPVESVMVEARVYDKAGGLIESRLAYAGIVPDTSEFTRQPPKDIDALLTSDPASPGSTLPAGDIPFAVAFFGKPAQDGTSYQVEVKDIRWK